jgi:hypothetical protein
MNIDLRRSGFVAYSGCSRDIFLEGVQEKESTNCLRRPVLPPGNEAAHTTVELSVVRVCEASKVIGYELADRCSISGRGKDFFCSPPRSDRLWGLPLYNRGCRGLFPRGQADHSSPSNAKVKNEWNCTFTSPHVFVACYLVKYREDFTFTSSLRMRL